VLRPILCCHLGLFSLVCSRHRLLSGHSSAEGMAPPRCRHRPMERSCLPQMWVGLGAGSGNIAHKGSLKISLWEVTALDDMAYGGSMCDSTRRSGSGCHCRTMVSGTVVDAHTPLRRAPRPLRGPFTCWPRVADAVLAIVGFVVAALVSFEDRNQDFAVRRVGGLVRGDRGDTYPSPGRDPDGHSDAGDGRPGSDRQDRRGGRLGSANVDLGNYSGR